MALITRCPSCLTSFQVTGSQLEQASGWVRCGRCDHIFHGGSQLRPAATEPLATEPLATEPLVTEPLATEPRAAEPRAIEPTSADPVGPTPDLEFPAENHAVEPETAPASWQPPRRSDTPLEPTFTPATPATQAALSALATPANADLGLDTTLTLAQEPVFEPAPNREPVSREPVSRDPVDHEPALAPGPITPDPPLTVEPPPVVAANDDGPPSQTQDAPHFVDEPLTADPLSAFDDAPSRRAAPSFVAQAKRRAFWRHGAVRSVLGLAAGLLVFTLVAQSVILQRDRIAAHYPQSLPILNALCETAGCTVAPYRDLQALQIDSSSLKETEGDALALEISLHNRQAIAVAMPALELTLSDLNGQILTRRALLPADLAAPQKLAASSRWQGQVALVPTPSAPERAVVNYKLKMFYP